jgi:ribosomal protein L37AE/L43A
MTRDASIIANSARPEWTREVIMSKNFKCEACKRPQDVLHMRNSDGKWVCPVCIPTAELNAYPGLRERLGLSAKRASAQHKKAA